MVAKIFDQSLRGFCHRAPFQPFTVELMSGANFTVDHPEALVFRAGQAVYIGLNGSITLFDHQSVSRLIGPAESSPRRATRRRR